MTALTKDGSPAYRDPKRSAAIRVDDLMTRMTTAEKVAQLGSAWVFQLVDGTEVSVDAAQRLMGDGLGQVTRISGASDFDSRDAAAAANSIQRFLVEQTRLGIPAIIHEEVCSGLMARGATVFPQPIGLASTWDPELVFEMAQVVREEMRALGVHQGLAPVLEICRDPRWGRTEETFGEDPYLVSRMGIAFVKGLQGDDLSSGVIATAKHLVGYGGSEGGLNWAPAHLPPRELLDVHLLPFEAAIAQAGLRSVMPGYHELDGVPCGADQDLLVGWLRDRSGFDGFVVSDYFAIRQLADYHHLASDGAEAAIMALHAGTDVELPSTDCYGAKLVDAIGSGAADADALDRAVRAVLRAKVELGLFETPYVDVDRAERTVGKAAHLELARHIAAESMVLLKNDGVLPLQGDMASVAVIGPNAAAARHLLGDYTHPAHVESLMEMHKSDNVFSVPIPEDLELDVRLTGVDSVLEALQNRLGDAVRYAEGCDVNGPADGRIATAVALAAECDVAILVVGDKAGLTSDCTSGESRDRSSLDLPGVQEELVEAVAATGTPVVLVIVGGRPEGSPRVHELARAVLMAWLPGEEGAHAIADVLTGASNPGGKLPISYPRGAGHIPVFYGHKVSGGRSHWKGDYVDSAVSPLYPFGHGLSFTEFDVTIRPVAGGDVPWSGDLTIDTIVANTGARAGDEIVQVYVRDPRASVTRPVLELKSFARVHLEAGASKAVGFRIPIGQLGFHDRNLDYVVEPGEVELFVGTSSTALEPVGSVNIVPDPSGRPVVKAFDGECSIA